MFCNLPALPELAGDQTNTEKAKIPTNNIAKDIILSSCFVFFEYRLYKINKKNEKNMNKIGPLVPEYTIVIHSNMVAKKRHFFFPLSFMNIILNIKGTIAIRQAYAIDIYSIPQNDIKFSSSETKNLPIYMIAKKHKTILYISKFLINSDVLLFSNIYTATK